MVLVSFDDSMCSIFMLSCGPLPKDTVARSFRGCGISNTLVGSEEGDWHGELAELGCQETRADFKQTSANFSFNGFESDD